MNKFLILFKTPVAGLDDWMKKPAEERKEVEDKMKADWDKWMMEHGANIQETAGAGKTKIVSGSGVVDGRNDVMLYAIVTADNHEAAAKMFEGHPHLGIPDATIEVMVANMIPGMSK